VVTRLLGTIQEWQAKVAEKTHQRVSLIHVVLGIVFCFISALYGAAMANMTNMFIFFFVAPIGLIVLWMAFSFPAYAAMLLISFRWGFIFDAMDQSFKVQSPAVLLALLLVMVMLVQRFGPEQRKLSSDPILWLMVVYLVYVYLGVWYAYRESVVITRVIDYAKDVIITLAIANYLISPQSFRGAIWIMIVIGGLLGTITVYQEITQTYTDNYWSLAKVKIAQIVEGMDDRPRASGPLGDPNFYGQQLVTFMPLAIWAVLNAKSWGSRALAGWALIGIIAGIGLSYSRGAYLAMIVAVIMFFYYVGFNPKYLAFIVPAAILAFSVAPDDLKARFNTLSMLVPADEEEAAPQETSFDGRTVEMLMAVYMFLDKPFFGVAADNYKALYQEYIVQTAAGAAHGAAERNSHSYYLEVAAEHGLVGLGIVLSMMWIANKRFAAAGKNYLSTGDRRTSDLLIALRVSYISYLFSAIFLHGAFPRFLWLYMAIAVAVYKGSELYVEEHLGKQNRSASAEKPVTEVPAQSLPQPAA
jgi:O-antigen ligase